MPDQHLRNLRHRIAARDVLLVVGAGASMAATGGAAVATWVGLLENGLGACDEADIPADWGGKAGAIDRLKSRKLDLLEAANVVAEALGAPGGVRYTAWLDRTVGSLMIQDYRVPHALRDLGLPILTTNYDNLLEQATGRTTFTWKNPKRLDEFVKGRDKAILHIHGHHEFPDSVIFDIKSYLDIKNHRPAQAALRGLVASKILLFVGCGDTVNDPNFKLLLDEARAVYAGSTNPHYRLGTDDEVARMHAENPGDTLFIPIAYGPKHDDLPAFLDALAPPHRAPAKPTLPPPPTFIGPRTQVHELVQALLAAKPTPTPVIGSMGLGKTTVTRVALGDPKVKARFGDRRYFVYCEGQKSRDDLVRSVALAVGVPMNSQDLKDLLLATLAEAPAALVLDNAETPWEAHPEDVEDFMATLAALPGLALAASFRGLEYPTRYTWGKSIEVIPLEPPDAKEVFSQATDRKFRDDPHLDPLLEKLAGIPLAICLLAAVARPERHLKVILDRWEDEKTAMLQRHGDNRRESDFDVSLSLSVNNPRMDAHARRLLALLGEFPAGFAVDDLDHVLPGGVAHGARHKLIQLALTDGESERLRVLPPIGDYLAKALLPSAVDLKCAIDPFLQMASVEGRRVGWDEGELAARRLASEITNIEHAIDRGLSRSDPSTAIDAACGLAEFSRFTGLGTAGLLERAREAARVAADGLPQAKCLSALGNLALARSLHDEATRLYDEARPMYRRVGDVLGEANCIQSLGDIALRRSRHDEATRLYDEARPMYRRVGDVLGEANCIQSLGDIALRRSRHDEATRLYDEARPMYRRVGDVLGEANCIQSLGDLALARSLHDEATRLYDEARPMYRRVGYVGGEANCIRSLGDIALRRSRHDEATRLYDEARPMYRRVGDVLGEANCIQSLGDLALARSLHDEATRLYDEARPMYRRVGSVLGEANCIQRLGDIALRRSRHDEATRLYDEARPMYRRVGSVLGEANCIRSLGDIALRRSRHDEATRLYDEARPMYRRVGDILGEANCIQSLGDLALARSLHDEATRLYDEARPMYRRVGDVLGEANCIQSLGDIARNEGRLEEARGRFVEALSFFSQIPEPYSMGRTHQRLARIARDEAERARLLAAAREAWAGIGREDLVAELDAEFPGTG